MDDPLDHSVNKMQVIAVVLFATVCVAIGETLLSVGMKQAHRGDVEGFRFVLAAAANKFVLGGTGLMMVFFALYSLALSWAEISFVLPFTALSYLFVALMAHFILHEHVSPTRWIGTLLILIGVVVVGLGERR